MHVGWIQDTQTHTDLDASSSGIQQEIVDDYDHWLNTVGVSEIYHGGDVVHSVDESTAPIAEPSAYDQFFSLID